MLNGWQQTRDSKAYLYGIDKENSIANQKTKNKQLKKIKKSTSTPTDFFFLKTWLQVFTNNYK